MPDVSIVVPVFNEVDNLAPLVDELGDLMRSEPETTFEVVLVDDGSTDGSLESLRDLAAQDERYRVVRHRLNAGQSAALVSGF